MIRKKLGSLNYYNTELFSGKMEFRTFNNKIMEFHRIPLNLEFLHKIEQGLIFYRNGKKWNFQNKTKFHRFFFF